MTSGPRLEIQRRCLSLSPATRFRQNEVMNSVEHPLDWWAYGGYAAVIRELGCTKAVARHKVHQKIEEYYRRTGDLRWRPIGHRGYAQLRRAIMAGQILDNDLH